MHAVPFRTAEPFRGFEHGLKLHERFHALPIFEEQIRIYNAKRLWDPMGFPQKTLQTLEAPMKQKIIGAQLKGFFKSRTMAFSFLEDLFLFSRYLRLYVCK